MTTERVAKDFEAYAEKAAIGYLEKQAIKDIVVEVLGPDFLLADIVVEGIAAVIAHEYPLGVPVSKDTLVVGVVLSLLVGAAVLAARGTRGS